MKSFDLLKMVFIQESRAWTRKTGVVEIMHRSNKRCSKILKSKLFDSKTLALLRIKHKLSLKKQKSLLAKFSFRLFFKKNRTSTFSITKILYY
jgi:hypothetical protein